MSASEDRVVKVNPLVKIGVVGYLLLMFSWSLPRGPEAMLNGTIKPTFTNVMTNPGDWLLWANSKVKDKSPTSYVIMWGGLWQYWDMFAPNPASIDIYLDSYVEYADGTTREVMYPRMYDLPLGEKYFMERYRKYVERVSGDDFSNKWPQMAYWMAAQAWTDPDNPPVSIRLRRNWRQVLAMDERTPDGYEHYFFFDTEIDRAELERFKTW